MKRKMHRLINFEEMFQNKTLRIVFFSLVFLASVGMFLLYFSMSRSLPDQAQCIPKNAFIVVTLNTKGIANDLSSKEHLFPEYANQTIFEKEFLPIKNAILNNNGSGLNESKDLIAFMYQTGDAAFIGLAFSVSDSSILRKLMCDQLIKQFPISEIYGNKIPLFQYDTSAAVIGWNDKSLLLLYPFSNHSVSVTSLECEKLLKQTKENSILENENFCSEQLNTFDASVWVQAKPLLTFTNGGYFFKTQLDEVDFLSLEVEFENGEIDIKKISTAEQKTNSIKYNSPLLISGDPKNVTGFIHTPINLENKNLLSAYLHSMPLSNIPFDEEKIMKLIPTFTGNCSLLFHDTLNYEMPYFTSENNGSNSTNRKILYEKIKTRATSICIELKNDAEAKKIFNEIAIQDSLDITKYGWAYSDNGLQTRCFIINHVLTITTNPESDGKPRIVPEQWQGVDAFLPMGEFLNDNLNSDFFFFFPQLANSQKMLGEHFRTLTVSTPLVTGKIRTSTICQRMENKNVNALIQLSDLIQKILKNNQYCPR